MGVFLVRAWNDSWGRGMLLRRQNDLARNLLVNRGLQVELGAHQILAYSWEIFVNLNAMLF